MSKRAIAILVAIVAVGAIAGATIAFAGSDSEGGATGPEADRAVQAALSATDGGTANAVERDSEDGATWEVEVTTRDGRVVDVRLDENYEVVVIEGDIEAPDDDDAEG